MLALSSLTPTAVGYQPWVRHIWLMPHNPAYAPIPGDNAEIIGKVTAVLRGGL